MNFENKVISFKPKSLFEDKDLQAKLLLKKQKLIDSYRPKETSFSDIYSEDEIKRDMQDIERLEDSWKKNTEEEIYIKNISSIYEGVISDQIDSNAWFGEKCESVPTSKYDDIKNGIDVVGIFNTKEYIGLGVDVTFSSNKKILEEKLESIKQCIRSGSIPCLKYFQDPETKEHKKISLPKVIIGSRISSAEKLIRLWGEEGKDRNKKLINHPVASKIILESLSQLMYFYEYSYKLAKATSNTEPDKSKKYLDISIMYANMYNIFYDIYQSKKEIINSHLNEISDDIVYETILNYCSNKNII